MDTEPNNSRFPEVNYIFKTKSTALANEMLKRGFLLLAIASFDNGEVQQTFEYCMGWTGLQKDIPKEAKHF